MNKKAVLAGALLFALGLILMTVSLLVNILVSLLQRRLSR